MDAWDRRDANDSKNDANFHLYNTDGDRKAPSYMYDIHKIDSKVVDAISDYIQDQLAKWTGIQDLRRTAIYGFRDYKCGAVLKMHLDKFQTHALSAIINIDQDMDWPLVAFCHKKKRYEEYFDTCDVLLYESGTVIHGRPIPFRGETFVNIFVHFTCNDWDERVANPMKEEGWT